MARVDIDYLLSPHPHAREAFEKLSSAGFRTVIVGGAVRDALLAKYDEDFSFDPKTADIDIATSASTDQIKETLPESHFVEVGESFGVLVLVAPDGNNYELAQFRKESNYDGRKPGDVRPTDSLEEDVKRRDFTVNGLVLQESGEVLDLVGGIDDLKDKVIRAIGDPMKRFTEDYLRPLRAVRFSCYLGAEIEPATARAIGEVAGKITSISRERIKEELFNILGTDNSSAGLRFCKKTGLLAGIIPEMLENEGVPQPEEYHPEGDVLEHSFQALEVADRLDFPPLTKLAVFTHDVGKAEAYHHHEKEHMGGHALVGRRKAKKIASRLRLSNEESRKLTWLVENHMRGSVLPEMRRAKQVKLIRYREEEKRDVDDFVRRYEYFASLLRVIIADSEASSHEEEGWLPVLKEFTQLLPHLRHLERLGAARSLVNGNDLLDMGLEEGPRVGEVLELLHDMIYAGEVRTRDDALKEARKIINETA